MKQPKFLAVLALVGLLSTIKPAVAEENDVKKGNLDDSPSVISPRLREGGAIAVDGGLAYLLNRYLTGVQGEQKLALQKAKDRLETATQRSKDLAADLKLSLDAHAKAAARAEVVRQQLIQLAGDQAHHTSKYISNGGKLLDNAGAIHLGRTVAGVELSAAEARALELLIARDQAIMTISDLGADVNGAKDVITKSGKVIKVLRIVGTSVIVLDAIGHGWAFYENSKTPVLMGGGLWTLGDAGYDAIYNQIEAKLNDPSAKIAGLLDTPANLPRRTAVPAGTVHRNNLPPLQKSAPVL